MRIAHGMRLQKRKNKLTIAVLVLAALLLPAVTASAEKDKVRFSESGGYWVFYSFGVSRAMPELGPDTYRELNYKLVYRSDWAVAAKDRLVEVLFMDKSSFYVVRDVAAGKNFNSQGEFYGSLWLPEKRAGDVKRVEIRETVTGSLEAPLQQTGQNAGPAVTKSRRPIIRRYVRRKKVQPGQAPAPPAESKAPQPVITNDVITKTLSEQTGRLKTEEDPESAGVEDEEEEE